MANAMIENANSEIENVKNEFNSGGGSDTDFANGFNNIAGYNSRQNHNFAKALTEHSLDNGGHSIYDSSVNNDIKEYLNTKDSAKKEMLYNSLRDTHGIDMKDKKTQRVVKQELKTNLRQSSRNVSNARQTKEYKEEVKQNNNNKRPKQPKKEPKDKK